MPFSADRMQEVLFYNKSYKDFDASLNNLDEYSNKEIKKEKPIFGVFKGRLKTPDNFNEPLDDFNEYMY